MTLGVGYRSIKYGRARNDDGGQAGSPIPTRHSKNYAILHVDIVVMYW